MKDTQIETANRGVISLALSRQVVVMALKVSLLVGTVLAFINHGDRMLTMSLSSQNLLQILLTYLVPYCVSTWSAVKTLKANMAVGNNV